jgi:hypothetical protein
MMEKFMTTPSWHWAKSSLHSHKALRINASLR